MTTKKLLSILILLTILTLLIAGCQARAGPGGAVMMTQQTWTKILGLFVPIVAVGIMQMGFTKKINSLIALVITLGFALLDAWYFGQLANTENLVNTVFDILVTAITTYTTIWKPLGVIDWWADATTFRRYRVKFIGDARESPFGLPW